MITQDAIGQLPGTELCSNDGSKIGKIDDVYVDEQTGQLTFATVSTGLFGMKSSFVPLNDATYENDKVMVPYDSSKVKDAPSIDKDQELSPQEEQELYSYYGVSAGRFDGEYGDYNDGFAATGKGTTGYDTSGPTTDDAMTRSEEKLSVGTEKEEAGRARLKKYVTTENVTQTIPVSHEEVRIEREPITDGNVEGALDGPTLSEEEHEVVLTEERPVVAKETVPVERVRLETETVTDEAAVTEDVKKEQLDVDGADVNRT